MHQTDNPTKKRSAARAEKDHDSGDRDHFLGVTDGGDRGHFLGANACPGNGTVCGMSCIVDDEGEREDNEKNR